MSTAVYTIQSYGDADEVDNSTYTPYGNVRQFFEYTGAEAIVSGPYDTGKAGHVDSVVYTPSGPRRMGDISPGDLVLSVDGTPTAVLGVYPQGVVPIYRVTFHDGASTLVSDDHLWMVGRRNFRRESASVNPARPRILGSGYDDWRVMTTNELRGKRLVWKAGRKKDTRRQYWTPTAAPAQFKRRYVTIPPYVMGILIAEGSLGHGVVGFSSGDDEIVERVKDLLFASNVSVSHRSGPDYNIVSGGGKGDGYWHLVDGYGLANHLSYDKFIPEDYLYNDIESRIDLLRGLMDGDGTVDKRFGKATYTTVSKRLAEDVRTLIESLGGYVSSIYKRPCAYTKDGERVLTGATEYRLGVVMPSSINPFALPRKANLIKRELEPRRFIDSIEYAFDGEAVCIEVAHPSHLYLTDRFIVTHNTLSMMHKLNLLMWMYPGSRALMVRKSYKALLPSALETYYSKVLPVPPTHPQSRVHVYGGGVPQWIDYDEINGKSSRIMLGGMDVPEKVLSSEYDFIAVPQAEELSQHDWEQLLGRCSGRAGNAPFHQLMGDCNPDTPSHWILHRKTLRLFHAKHTDNPTLFQRGADGELVLDEKGNPTPTEGGKGRLDILRSLTGLRYKRGYLGMWVGAEGQVYDNFDPAVHIIEPFDIPPDWRKYRAIDFGYTHPFTTQWWAEDEDGRLYLYREIYMSKRTVKTHVEGYGEAPGILALSGEERYEATICDWDAEDRATLAEYGIVTIPADKRIQVGIEKFQERMKVQGDGRPRIFFMRNSLVEVDETLKDIYQPVRLTEEFPGYVWRNMSNRRETTSKDEVPMRVADHGCLVAGTAVMTNRGEVPIENICAGDSVLTRDGFSQVASAGMTDDSASVFTVEFSDGRTITGTGDHPVWVRGKGFIQIDELRYMDLINTPRTDFAPVHVVRVIGESKKQPVYNLQVAGAREYYANGVLVHNCDAARYMIMHLDGGGAGVVTVTRYA